MKKKTKKEMALTDPKKIAEKLKELNLDWKVGDTFIDDHGYLLRISSITTEHVSTEFWRGGDAWNGYGSWTFDELKRNPRDLIKVTKSYEEIEKDVFDRVLKVDTTTEKEPEISTSTAIIETDTKKMLEDKMNSIEQRRQDIELMKRILENKRSDLQSMVRRMEEKISKIRRVICQIELYLGINEQILQLQQGPSADSKELIYFRQQILYMDEEYGAIENDGLDFQNVEEFDDWLVKERHFERLVPEKKCVVVLRVRRHDKDYHTGDWREEAKLNYANKMTYILIRNGENIYRIYAQLIIKPRLFPLREEIQKLYDDFRDNKGEFEHGFNKDKFEDRILTYQQNFLLLQGLLDRTPIFQPLKHRIILFQPDTYDGVLEFIYDDEVSLTEGRMYYEEWHKLLNSKIKRGTRIYFAGFDYYTRYDKSGNRRLQFPHHDNPNTGIYSVDRIEQHESAFYKSLEEHLICHYNPKDEIWHRGWTRVPEHERMKSMYFVLKREDDFVLNYDLIDLDTMEYYINSRIDREDYLKMLPCLYAMKKLRIEEIKWEAGFVKSMALELECDEKMVWDAVNWWKHKVIWKRPIRQDDAKAWRMIKGRLKRQLR